MTTLSTVVPGTAGDSRRPPSATARRRRGDNRAVVALLGPSLLVITVFVVVPVVLAVYLSFTDTTLIGFGAQNPQFVGVQNYGYLLGNEDFIASLGRTGLFILLSAIIGQTVLGMVAALLLSRPYIRAKGVFGGAILLPMVVPEVVASLTWASMLAPGSDGTVNRLVALVGAEPVAWLQTNPLTCVIVVNIWRGIAFAMIMFQAAIEGVPEELVEAARIDGAGAVQVFRHVVLPLIRGPVFLYLLLTTITTASVFGLVYFLTQGGPGSETQLTAIYIYERAFAFFQIGLGSAASVILLVVILVLGLTYVRLAKVEV